MVALLLASCSSSSKEKIVNREIVIVNYESPEISTNFQVINMLEHKGYSVCDTVYFPKIATDNTQFFAKLQRTNRIKLDTISASITRLNLKSNIDNISKCNLIFDIWRFEDKDQCHYLFDYMKSNVYNSSYLEKPPKVFFRNSNDIYFFTVGTYNKQEEIFNLQEIVKKYVEQFSEDVEGSGMP